MSMMPGITVIPVASMTRSARASMAAPGIALPENSRCADGWMLVMVLPSMRMSTGPRLGLPAPSMSMAFLIRSRA